MDTWRHTQDKQSPCESMPSVHSSTTPKQYYLYTHADIPSADRTPLIDAKCTYPYYTKREIPIDQGTQSSPLIDPMCTESYHTTTVLPIDQGSGCHLNQPQVYKALLHQNSIIYGHMQTYPMQTDPLPVLIDPKRTESYYTKTVVPSDQGTQNPPNWPQVYRNLLYQNSSTKGSGHTDLLLIDPKCT